jgi:predicted acylesterase/phospholipase RssA
MFPHYRPRESYELDRIGADEDDANDGYDATALDSAQLDAAELATAGPNLLLQRMERRLVRTALAQPHVLADAELRRLRYILNFARLTDFEPGAAGPGGKRGRGDLRVGPELTQWRARVVDTLHGPLRKERNPITALTTARAALESLAGDQDEQRSRLIQNHANDCSAAEIDAEVGVKKLVVVMGGGGGAGFVYIGGMRGLLESGQVPDYMIGSSFGSIMGAVVGRVLPVPIEEYVAWAKTVSYRAILGPERMTRRHGLTGLFSLRFDKFAHAMFTREDDQPMRMSDLGIPFDTVIAGVRKRSFDALPPKYRHQELAALRLRFLPHLPIGAGPQVAARMWQVAAFIDSRVVKAVVVGGDELTSDFNVVDAASFSSAIPGVLHHETRDPRMVELLDALLDTNDVAALVDGGAASNVPVELAWKRVRDGRLGTRNACYVAFDCFHPQLEPRHLWLSPIAQAVQLQVLRNVPYADHVVRFSPTLSPVNLAPSAASIDRACGWGQRKVTPGVPLISALRQPIWWEGESPAVAEAATTAPAKPMAWPMSTVLKASPAVRNRYTRWRDRHLT